MSENGKAQVRALGAGVVAFLAVASLGAWLILSPKAEVRPPEASYPPVDVGAPLSVPRSPELSARAGAPAGQSPASAASSPAPLPPGAETTAAPTGSSGAAATAAGDARRASSPFAPLRGLGALEPASSSAKASVESAPAAKPAKKEFVPPKLDTSKGQGIAATVHYSVTSRAELMGRRLGPVYNFKKKDPGSSTMPVATSGQALEKIDEAQKQIDGAGLDAQEKARLDSGLNQIRQDIKSGGQ